MTDSANQTGQQATQDEELLDRIGQLTRALHDSMRELGLQQEVEKVAEAIPDARDRLNYVATTTEQAAERALTSIEVAQPLQEEVERRAGELDRRWQEWFDAPKELDEARDLVKDTRGYLKWVPEQTQATNSQLLEIMMAQDFQDLTGQVIKRMTGVIQEIEEQLVQVLLDNMPEDRMRSVVEANKEGESLMNGPQVNAEGKDDVVSDQDQVDDLLDSLGF